MKKLKIATLSSVCTLILSFAWIHFGPEDFANEQVGILFLSFFYTFVFGIYLSVKKLFNPNPLIAEKWMTRLLFIFCSSNMMLVIAGIRLKNVFFISITEDIFYKANFVVWILSLCIFLMMAISNFCVLLIRKFTRKSS